jgi:hypothetical protein
VYTKFYFQLVSEYVGKLETLAAMRLTDEPHPMWVVQRWNELSHRLRQSLVRFMQFCANNPDGTLAVASPGASSRCRVVADLAKTYFKLWFEWPADFQMPEVIGVAFARLEETTNILLALVAHNIPKLMLKTERRTQTHVSTNGHVTFTERVYSSYSRRVEGVFPVQCADACDLLQHCVKHSTNGLDPLVVLGNCYFRQEELSSCVSISHKLIDRPDVDSSEFMTNLQVHQPRIHGVVAISLEDHVMETLRLPQDAINNEVLTFITLKKDRWDSKWTNGEKTAWFRSVLGAISAGFPRQQQQAAKARLKQMFPAWAELVRQEFAATNSGPVGGGPDNFAVTMKANLRRLIIGQLPAVDAISNALAAMNFNPSGRENARVYFLPGPSGNICHPSYFSCCQVC